MSRDIRVVLVTAPDGDVAERLAATLVGEGLAACANLIPGIVSIYRWKGETHRDAEVLLVLKSTADRCRALTQRVAELHPYDVPEVLVLPVEQGYEPYLAWVRSEVEPRP